MRFACACGFTFIPIRGARCTQDGPSGFYPFYIITLRNIFPYAFRLGLEKYRKGKEEEKKKRFRSACFFVLLFFFCRKLRFTNVEF